MKRRILGLGALLLIVAAGLYAALGPGGAGSGGPDAIDPAETADRKALAAADAFLDRYVDPDGRVVRRDQGGDTVSEGQAYAMLISVGVDDRARFDRTWRWTRENLQRPDGLLSYLWRDGHVEDPQAASDADLDAVRALLLAADRFGEETYRREALRIAKGIVEQETAAGEGRAVLLAGPWADFDDRLVLNPSYFAPRSYALLAEATGDDAWNQLSASSREIVTGLTANGSRLPPNWAVLEDGEAARPSGPPNNEGEPADYGFDAARLPLRYAESCDPRDRALAAGVWRVLGPRGTEQLSTRHSLDGAPSEEGVHPVGLVGAAAAAQAAGEHDTTTSLLTRADELDSRFPTYYGSALIALGRLMLTTDRLGACGTAGER